MPTLNEERAFWQAGYLSVAGVDEAGRGAWAGPVFAAAVILPPFDTTEHLRGLTDSKQLTPSQRERFAAIIREVAVSWGVGWSEAAEIDALGIVAATRLAMQRAIAALHTPPQALLIDALALPSIALPQRAFPCADSLSLSVAAASVMAKTARDAHMCSLDAVWPGYDFARHKGYGTRHHRERIQALGVSPTHRRSFKPLRALVDSSPKGSIDRAPAQHNAETPPRAPCSTRAGEADPRALQRQCDQGERS